MKRFTFSRIALCILCGASIFALPSVAFGGWFPQNSGTSYWLYSIHFPVDDLTGYAVGTFLTVLRTTDGGTNWVTVHQSGEFVGLRSVHFVDDGTGFAVGGANNRRIIGKTTDKGTTWDWQNTFGVRELYSVHFPVDTLIGYAATWEEILKTTDGGANWNQILLDSNLTLLSIHFPVDAQTGYAVGAYDILKTTDGGANWINQSSSYYLYSVSFPTDAQTGYGVGAYGTIVKTTDGGANWIPQTSGTSEHLQSVDFPVDAQTGYAVGGIWPTSSIILKTTDGGANWVPQTSGTDNVLYSVHFPVDDLTGYAAGYLGTILKTTDGGVWVEEEKDQGINISRYQSYIARPNPFTSFTTILEHETECFNLYDVSGRHVGIYKGNRIGANLLPGVYFIMQEDKQEVKTRIVKVR